LNSADEKIQDDAITGDYIFQKKGQLKWPSSVLALKLLMVFQIPEIFINSNLVNQVSRLNPEVNED
jgi:hypothetical protein